MAAEGIKPVLWGRMLLTLAPSHMAPAIQDGMFGRNISYASIMEQLLLMSVGPSYKGELYSALISRSQGSDKVLDYYAKTTVVDEALGLNVEPCVFVHECGLECTLTSNAVAAYSFTRGLRHDIRKGLTVRFSDVSQYKLPDLAQHAQAIEQSNYQSGDEDIDRRNSSGKGEKPSKDGKGKPERGEKRKAHSDKDAVEKKRRRKENLCYKCGKEGHMARDFHD